MDNNKEKIRKQNITIIYLVLLLALIGLLVGFLCWILNNPQSKPDPEPEPKGKATYDSLVLAINEETKKIYPDEEKIVNSKINTLSYENNALYVNYTYNDVTTLLYEFTYENPINIEDMLTSIETNNKLPTYTYVPSLMKTTLCNPDEYKSVINEYYNKTFSKVTASAPTRGENAYVTGLVKNSDNTITVVDKFKVETNSKKLIDAGYKADVNVATSKYYNLLDYILSLNQK